MGISTYSNRFATVEKVGPKRFECYSEVTGLYVKTVTSWAEAKAFLDETRNYYFALEFGHAVGG